MKDIFSYERKDNMSPCYNYKCTGCGHADEIFMKYRDYKLVVQCPSCNQESYTRVWAGSDNVPGIKTVKRLEEVWKEKGLLDPEDPAFQKVHRQRVRAMREDAIKARDEKLNKADMKKGRTRDFKPTRRRADHVSKQDLDKLPDVAKDRVNMDEIAKGD